MVRKKSWVEKLCTIIVCMAFPIASIGQQVKFNHVTNVACHNCYEKKRALDFQDVFRYTTTIELDIWNESFGLGIVARMLGKSLEGDWYVKHQPHQRGNKNIVDGSLRDCLLQIKAWSDANPLHPVITIFLDKKQNWGGDNGAKRPADLDRLLLSVFSKNDIFFPEDLLQDHKNLKAAAGRGWPTLEALIGKFLFVITDGTIINLRKPLQEYQDAREEKAACFVAPKVTSEKEIVKPKGFSKATAENIVVYNLKERHSELAEKINDLDCISRVYSTGKTESYEFYKKIAATKANFIALYNFKIAKETEEQIL